MTFLVDANLSPQLVRRLIDAGCEATHVGDLGLLSASDDMIFDHAAAAGQVVITADTDFSMLLGLRNAARPSVVLLRHLAETPSGRARQPDRRRVPVRPGHFVRDLARV